MAKLFCAVRIHKAHLQLRTEESLEESGSGIARVPERLAHSKRGCMSRTGTKISQGKCAGVRYRSVLRSGGWFAALVSVVVCGQSVLIGQTAKPKVTPKLGNLPLSFTANQGQADPNVKFLANGPGYSLALTNRDAVLKLNKASRNNPKDRLERQRNRLLG